MSFVRKSKYRHVFGELAKPENQYQGMKGSNGQLDSQLIKVNGKYIAYIMSGVGGGSVGVFPMTQVGRHTTNPPMITGHTRPVSDIDFNPFNTEVIATGAEDCNLRIFKIPESGIPADGLKEAQAEMTAHGRKINQILWNPAASDILATSGADNLLKIWDAEAKTALFTLEKHEDAIQDFQWNQLGSMIATQCRDRKVRVFDIRANNKVLEIDSHKGAKSAKLVYDNTRNWLISTGFGQGSNRQLMIWDLKAPEKPLYQTIIDQGSGVMTPFFDEATQILFVTGKGEANIRYYELTDEKPHCFYISTSGEGNPQRGIATLPKRFVNTSKCEIMRFYRLTAKDTIEPISMIVPRRSEMFQDDIYPPVVDHCTASMTAAEWKSGKNTPQRYFVFNAEGKEEYTDAPKREEVKFSAVPKAASSSTGGADVAALQARIKELEKENAELKAQIKTLTEAVDSQ